TIDPAAASATGTILNDDPNPRYSVVASVASAIEGTPPGAGGELVFTVSRNATWEAETVTYALAGTATAGSDYVVPSGTVSFAIGQTPADTHIAVTPDIPPEPNESVTLTLIGTSGPGTIDPAAAGATGTILNDDVRTSDFNPDGHSDILWQNADGTPAIWTMN